MSAKKKRAKDTDVVTLTRKEARAIVRACEDRGPYGVATAEFVRAMRPLYALFPVRRGLARLAG